MKAFKDNQKSILNRLWIYQSERFPVLGHGIMISAFTFSAISYSRICRAEVGFINLQDFIIGIFASITLFLLVRIFDEFKDHEDDLKYRAYLPVPRGLVSLLELKRLGLVVAFIQIATIAYFQPRMLWLYGIVLLYLGLMGAEFFVADWLKKRQIAYITSHMLIIPLIDLYSSGLDWNLSRETPHIGLAWFIAVSFFNGIVLEFGRKMRTPEKEEPGVLSYTKMYGIKKAPLFWTGLLSTTAGLAMGAASYANYTSLAYWALGLAFILCVTPGILFIKSPSVKLSKLMEYSSALWTILMYLTLGAFPMIKSYLA